MVTAAPTALLSQPSDIVTNPIRLSIPAIGINALVEPVGILSNGDIATPTQSPWENVGWYNAGPRPGERGSAVIDGHLDRPGGYPAVFWRLRDLHVGDDVLVLSTDGKIRHFHVTRIALYTPQAAPVQDIFGNKGGTYLNLITCAGDWIASQHQTTLRLVIYTSLE
jgi:LPXTG-site transpeptidase (sortase) family protein